jgi:hypothetical protein
MVGYTKIILILHTISLWILSCTFLIKKPNDNIEYLLCTIAYAVSLGFAAVLHSIENK